jgi:hypothetical protein
VKAALLFTTRTSQAVTAVDAAKVSCVQPKPLPKSIHSAEPSVTQTDLKAESVVTHPNSSTLFDIKSTTAVPSEQTEFIMKIEDTFTSSQVEHVVTVARSVPDAE